ncbi:hypothetical protein [Tetragenococcus halophilus]
MRDPLFHFFYIVSLWIFIYIYNSDGMKQRRRIKREEKRKERWRKRNAK